MSGPLLVGCAAVALCLGIPVLAASSQLVAAHRLNGVADAAALAAADALTGWIDAEPCYAARAVAAVARADLTRCDVDEARAEVRITLTGGVAPMTLSARARAGGEADWVSSGEWAWPSAQRAITQGLHDGMAIDLEAPRGSRLLAPADGVVIAAGPDGGGKPRACATQPGWWRGENEQVLIRHEINGAAIFSSHNHVAPGSAAELGIRPGVRVRAGQAVAKSGMSGCTSGPHSHFTLSTRPANSFPDLNPFAYIGPPGNAITGSG